MHHPQEQFHKIIISSLSLKKDVLNDNLNKLFLRTNYRIDETSKNSKGKVKTYRSVIIVEVDISKNNKILNSKKIEKNFSYNNVSNKYELVEYQNKIKTDLIDGILEEIILFLNLG